MVKLIRDENKKKEKAKKKIAKVKNSLIEKHFINTKKSAFVKTKNVMLSN